MLVDTGALVALFDPSDPDHAACARVLAANRLQLATTVPVLTEAFYMLESVRHGHERLIRFVQDARAVAVAALPEVSLWRAFALMVEYGGRMDFADASLVATAEALRIRTVFTLDRRDFSVYRATFGHKKVRLQVVP